MCAADSSTLSPLPAGGFLDLRPRWLPPADHARLLAALERELPWEQRTIVLFGREILQPRLIAWAGTRAYRYSGQTLEPRPAPPALAELWERVSDAAGCPFNHVLANRYRDGQDSMGMHSDDERELGPDPTVASLSLGARRRFVMKQKKGTDAHELSLGEGDLLIMGGSCQHHYRHGVPKEPAAAGERISLTFRRVLFDPAR